MARAPSGLESGLETLCRDALLLTPVLVLCVHMYLRMLFAKRFKQLVAVKAASLSICMYAGVVGFARMLFPWLYVQFITAKILPSCEYVFSVHMSSYRVSISFYIAVTHLDE